MRIQKPQSYAATPSRGTTPITKPCAPSFRSTELAKKLDELEADVTKLKSLFGGDKEEVRLI